MTSKKHPRPKLQAERSLDGYPSERLVHNYFCGGLFSPSFFFSVAGLSYTEYCP